MPRLILRLLTTSTGFPAIRYNMNKTRQGSAELICQANLGPLHVFREIKTSDLEHYFGAIAALNSKSHFDQFHAVISTKGKQIDQAQLLFYGQEFLKGMGYSQQPYLIFFHHDTSNSHIHLVSTDVCLNRSKINDSFDRIRGMRILNSLLGIDEQQEFDQHILPLMTYRFTSVKALTSLLKNKGYRFYRAGEDYLIKRYGISFAKINADKLTSSLVNARLDQKRIAQLRNFIRLSSQIHSPSPFALHQKLTGKDRSIIVGYSSDLADFLKRTAGVEVIYSFQRKLITGFSIIDNHCRQIIEGSELFALDEFLSLNQPIQQEASSRTLNQKR